MHINLWVLGIIIHFIFLMSIFDIYFKTPIIHGLRSFSPSIPPPAKRLVFVVADGLRADTFFQLYNGTSSAPYLRSIIKERGRWGISHTKVPTESRPGHVAMIGGFYEDVSAIMKGWKENPVEFDSVFNQTRFTWMFGSPDILSMFAKENTEKIFASSYSSEIEDFGSNQTYLLDKWVFDKFEELLNNSKESADLNSKLNQDKIVIFLHLLGSDTAGHASNPDSNEYRACLQLLDKQLIDFERNLSEFYGNDNLTAFIFTADHGMTDWGSHGAGDKEETMTPFLAWGAGIPGPEFSQKGDSVSELAHEWQLDEFRQFDIKQVDISPLMSTLIGVAIPTNSEGVLPLEYLNTSDEFRASAALANTRQLIEQCNAKMLIEDSRSAYFFPYKEFLPDDITNELNVITLAYQERDFKRAIDIAETTMAKILKATKYYRTYDRFNLCCCVLLSFIGWMAIILCELMVHAKSFRGQSHIKDNAWKIPITSVLGSAGFTISGSIISACLFYLNSPTSHYVYFLTPLFLACLVYRRLLLFRDGLLKHIKLNDAVKFTLGLMVLGELLVLSFYHREVISVGLFLLAFWPFLHSGTEFKFDTESVQWLLFCLLLAVFPQMPTVGKYTNYTLVCLSGGLGLAITIHFGRIFQLQWRKTFNQNDGAIDQQDIVIRLIQVVIILLSVLVIKSTSDSLSAKTGLQLANQIVAWTILSVSFVLIWLSSLTIYARLLSINSALFAIYLLLTTSYESLFYLCFLAVLINWMNLEYKASRKFDTLVNKISSWEMAPVKFYKDSKTDAVFDQNHTRLAGFFLFFMVTAFFGTGNFASINSFTPSSVYCFLTMFRPFTMMGLLLLKLWIPFMLLACVFRAITIVLKCSMHVICLIVVLISDFVAMHFFLLVRDEGSWLEIGLSISHFCISISLVIVVILLNMIASFFTTVHIRIPTSF